MAKWSTHRIGRAVAMASIVVATCAVQLLPRPMNNAWLAWVRALAEVFALGVVALRWRRWPQERRTWGFVAIGLGLFAFGDALAGVAFLEPGWLNVPGWASMLLLHLLPVPAFVAALAWWPPPSTQPAGSRARSALDALLFGYAAWYLIWVLGVRGWESTGHASEVSGSLVARFALLGVLLGACVYQGARDAARWNGPLAFLGVSFFGLTLAGGLLSASLLSRPGQDTWLRVVGYLLKAVAVLAIAAAASSERPLTGEPRPLGERLRDYLPYGPASVATVAAVFLAAADAPVDPLLVALAAPMVALLLLRQIMAFGELKRFSAELETRVEERTRALEEAQAVVRRTERMNTLAIMGAGLAHDVNNHLTTIRLSAELIASALRRGKLPSPEDCEGVLAASEQAGRLTQRMLRVGREERSVELLDLRAELAAAGKLLHALVPRRIRVELELADGHFPVAVKRDHLEQILVNLVSNARDAIEGDGRIVIGLRREGDGQVLVSVQDTGSGMSADVQARVFEPFFTTKNDTGTGLGLSSVRALVERHGGRIELDSRQAVGTTFTLRFPMAAASDAGPARG